MSGIKDQERLEELRERLYSRGKGPQKRKPFKLTDVPEEVPTFWKKPPQSEESATSEASQPRTEQRSAPQPPRKPPFTAPQPVVTPDASFSPPDIAPMAIKKKTHTYRLKILLAGIGFFVFAVAASSVYLMLGGNMISGDNIAISMSGPFTIGGGEVMPVQIGITNQNAVPIESATLIVEYPVGTQSADVDGKELFVDRLSLEAIGPGETINIPVRAVVFGEENEEKIISAAVEYRVRGSNATFFKEAEPLRFKISSSPVVLGVEAVHKISSGQETDIELTLVSNSQTELTNLLIRAEYPTGFDFTSSSPRPVSGQNVWLIESLLPEDKKTITIKGVMVGKESEEYVMRFSTGVANERDALELASVFSTASTEFEIEQPFLDVNLSVDGKGNEVSVEGGKSIPFAIKVTNTLEDTIYDGRAEVKLSGNALSDFDVDVSGGGFYDSTKRTIYWDASSLSRLREMVPGSSVTMSFSIEPDDAAEVTPQINVDVSVRARRALEDRVSEELIGTASGFVKVNSEPRLSSEVGRNVGSFSDYGPIPPVAGEETSYTLTLYAENGTNDIGDVEVTASLPGYVAWNNSTGGAGTITFNEVTRTLTWRVESIDANRSALGSFQVTLLPSISQIDTTPTLLGEQRLRATDRFTGEVVRATRPALTTELSTEAGFPEQNGRVEKP